MKLRRDELPLHFEGLRLRRWIVLAGWPLALAAAGVGVVLVGTSVQPLVDAVGLALGVLGAVLIAGLARCRRFEIVVGPSLLTVGAGPFRRRLPIGALGPPEVRAARSWRPVYADRELVLDVSDRGQRIIFPSADPEGLQAALTEAKTGSGHRTDAAGSLVAAGRGHGDHSTRGAAAPLLRAGSSGAEADPASGFAEASRDESP